MEEDIIKILESNFKGQNIDKARKELCILLNIERTDESKCPKCGSIDLTCLGSWETGDEYKCDNKKCNHVFDWNHFN